VNPAPNQTGARSLRLQTANRSPPLEPPTTIAGKCLLRRSRPPRPPKSFYVPRKIRQKFLRTT
jgi:hypothetical protein